MMTKNIPAAYPLWSCLLPFIVSVTLSMVGILYDVRIPFYSEWSLLLGAFTALGVGWWHGVSFQRIFNGIKINIKPILPTFFFLLLVGMLSTAWLLGGVIPAGIHFGIAYLKPSFFLVATTLFTGIMGLACGSSWLTTGTMGVAFVGIGSVLGFPKPLVVGAVISGAYFGDKLTPLSETTVLAASMTGTPLMRHVRYMLWTSLTAFGLALCLFGIWGLCNPPQAASNLQGASNDLQGLFTIRALWLLVPLVVMLLTILRVSPYITLTVGILLGYLAAFCYQDRLLAHITGTSALSNWEKVSVLLRKTFWGIEKIEHDSPIISNLNAHGIWGMRHTISIIIASLILSGTMEGAGLLDALIGRIRHVQSSSKLIVLATLGAIFFNITVADQYLAIILTAKMFGPLFLQQGLASENASRAVEDAATVTSPLIPWNTCGKNQYNTFKVPTMDYLPYSFYNLLSPLVSIFFMHASIKIARTKVKKPTPD